MLDYVISDGFASAKLHFHANTLFGDLKSDHLVEAEPTTTNDHYLEIIRLLQPDDRKREKKPNHTYATPSCAVTYNIHNYY